MEVINDLLEYKNLKIIQNPSMFSFSLDSVLLANFVQLNPSNKTILDIGCGNAPIPLILSTKSTASIVGIEIQSEVADMAHRSVIYNKLEHQIVIINEDVKEYSKRMESDFFDVITCNPPFFKYSQSSNLNKEHYKTIARHELMLNLSELFQVAKKLLKNNARIAIVHRPERMIDIIEKMRENNIEPKRIQLVYPSKEKPANILLIEGTKNGKPGIIFEAPIYTHESNGEYTEQVKKYFRG